MKKRMLISFLLAGTTVLSAGAAVNAREFPCPKDKACIFSGNDSAGLLDSRRAGGGVRNVSSTANDQMDSWENRTKENAAWYVDINGKGDCSLMEKGKRDNNVNFLASDELSSWKTNGGC